MVTLRFFTIGGWRCKALDVIRGADRFALSSNGHFTCITGPPSSTRPSTSMYRGLQRLLGMGQLRGSTRMAKLCVVQV